MNYNEFAEKIKNKYPQYQDMDNRELAEKIVKKNPVYASQVTFESPTKKVDTVVKNNQPKTVQYEPKSTYTGLNADIINNPNLTKEQKAAEIQKRGEAQRKQYDKDLNKWKTKAYTGLALELGSALIPVGAGLKLGGLALKAGKPIAKQVIANMAKRGAVEGALSGAVGGIGQGMVEDKDLKGIGQTALTDAGIGLVGGAALGAIGGKIATNVGKTGKRIKNIEAKQIATKQPQVTKEVKAEVVGQPIKQVEVLEQPIKQVDEVIDNTPKENLNTLKASIRNNKFDKGNLNDYRETHRTSKGFFSKMLDPESYDIKLSEREFNKIITKISKNPEEIRNGDFVTELEKEVQKILDKYTPHSDVDEVSNPYWEKFYKALDDAENYNLFKENKQLKTNRVIETIQTGGMKQSSLAQKANKSDEVTKAIKKNTPLYEAITNADTIAQAKEEIIKNADKVQSDVIKKLVNDNSDFTALDIEKTRQLFGELQKQGRFDEATELLELTSKQGSKLGQAVQAFSLWSKTTPDGAMLYAQKLLDKYNKGVRKNLQKKLTENELKDIGKAFQELNESGLTGRELEVETAKAMKKVFKVVPKTFAQKLDGYRYINMLLSGKSRIKDFLLTGKNALDQSIDESLAGSIDAIRSTFGKNKTRYISANPFAGTKAWLQGAKKGFKEGAEDVKFGINTSRSGEVGRYGLPNNPTFEAQELQGNLANKALTLVKNIPAYSEKLLRYSMQVPDRMFFEARFASSLANQMKARGVVEPTQDMVNSALKEAKKAVFQEDRVITQKMLSASKGLDEVTVNNLEKLLGIPQNSLPSFSKSLAPFIKTPTNVIAQGVEGLHGLASGSAKLKNAIEEASPEAIREAELLMGRGIRGLGELGIGYAVGKNIFDNVKTNIGEKDYYKNEITGLQPSSIVIGDKAFSMQNMQNNLPLFTGVGLGQGKLGKAFTNTTDVIAEMPALKALGDIYNINKEANYIAKSDSPDKKLLDKGERMVRSLGANYLTSLIPYGGELGEIRNDIDPYARELRDDENTLNYLKNRLVNRIPIASTTLPIRYNALGEPIMVNNIQNPIARTLSEAINFGVRNYNAPPTEMEEMQRIQDYAMENDIPGKTTLKFAKPKRYIKKDDEKINLTNEQYSELTRLYNGKLYDELQFLMNTPEYQSADEETQIKWVREVMKEMKEQAENELLN